MLIKRKQQQQEQEEEEVEDRGTIIDTFEWLDEARTKYPDATILPLLSSIPKDRPIVAGGGLDGDVIYCTNQTIQQLNDTYIPYKILLSFDLNLLKKYDSVISTVDQRIGSSMYSKFPNEDQIWIMERILFLLSPLPNNTTEINGDWCKAFLQDGYGAGLSERQTVLSILALRHLLCIHPLDASSKKPSLGFFYRELRPYHRSSTWRSR